MDQNLPQEIVDFIVGEFQMDDRVERQMVASCGLVCRSWFPSSRYSLFASVHLDHRTVKPFFDVAANSFFDIPSSIRCLGWSFSGWEGGFGLEESLRRLGPLPLVMTLRITMTDDILLQNSTLLASTFPDIHSGFSQSSTPPGFHPPCCFVLPVAEKP
ncbi:hypothetical protein B0H19DRAFT_1117235 [Mycena capillaripes]|nr:hypothetical protein B0H19DRAFT_1117235 [Mycena capillaripes]